MFAPVKVYPDDKAEIPSAILPDVRDALSRHPDLGVEEIASRIGAPPWLVEAAFQVLVVEGEVLP